MRLKPNINRMTRDVMELSEFSLSDESGYTRLSFSYMDKQARRHLSFLMDKEASLAVRIDAVGNIVGRREGTKKGPAILIGSHIDTVLNGGRFDGVSGVIAGIEVARRYKEAGIKTIHPLEVVVFLAEEPSPFGISAIGSRGMVGKLPDALIKSLKDDR
jgi:acetylornithine deacetylase/succinyl-diaminopimelate desuccinylase-like protein